MKNEKILVVTHGIVHAGFCGSRKSFVRGNFRCKPTGNRFGIPYNTIPLRWMH